MRSTIGNIGPASSNERKVAFLQNGPRMVSFLEGIGFKWVASRGYPDYHPDQPGGKADGRSIEGKAIDVKKLGEWRQYLLLNPYKPSIPVYTNEARFLALSTTLKGFLFIMRLGIRDMIIPRILGRVPMANGRSLVGQSLRLNLDRGIPIWRQSRLIDLVVKKGAVTGATVNRGGKTVQVSAQRGILLAAGGFAKNKQMRDQYGPVPASTEWTSIPPGDTGDAIRAGMKIGVATALMDDAWWGPTLVNPENGKLTFSLWERSMPHSIIVDSAGNRFMNESQSYSDAGKRQYEHNTEVPAIPAWLIVDNTHRRRYPLGSVPPGITPQSVIDSGFVTKADTIEELGIKIGVDVEGLAKTVKRFNEMAQRGVDEDYERGENAYDQFWGDARSAPNKNLGALERPPYHAVRVYPGDLGTKGGLLTDEYARVLREDGEPIRRLYAAGNTTASVMGGRYLGAGATLGPAMTFAFIAMNHLADSDGRGSSV